MSDESQRKTDYERGLADARASLHRYETHEEENWELVLDGRPGGIPYFRPIVGGERLSGANLKREGSDHAEASHGAPRPLSPDDWEGWLERRKQIDREEKRAFNERYGYTQ